ncbi:MAG: NAD(P)H-hydrate epimerase [Candidatus Dormibacteria bacterium]
MRFEANPAAATRSRRAALPAADPGRVPRVRWAGPGVTAEQSALADRLAVQAGQDLAHLIEAAGRRVAECAIFLFGPSTFVVAAGRGNNGADALVAGRVLREAGATVAEWRSDDPAEALASALSGGGVVIDGLLGTSIRGAPRGAVREAIRLILASGLPVLAVDLPSGIDPDGGPAPGEHLGAVATVCLLRPKAGILGGHGAGRAGRIFVGDVGMDPEAVSGAGIEPAPELLAGPLVELELNS